MSEGTFTRRGFIKLVGGAAVFTLGAFPLLSCASASAGNQSGFEPDVLLSIAPDGTVQVMIVKQEMGQGVRTVLAMLVAEELDADWTKVKVSQAPGDSKKYGGQGTGGSSSVRSMHGRMRKIGATARAMLVAAAAKQWNVDPASCQTEAGFVLHSGSGKKLSYGELTTLAAAVPVPAAPPLKSREQFKILRKPTPRIDNHDIVTGKAKYGIDVKIEGMAYAVIARPPEIGGSLVSFDDAAARKVPGVLKVVQVGPGVAVLGQNTWAALKGRDALKITWTPTKHPDLSSTTIRKDLVNAIGEHLAMPEGATVVTATFDFPYLSHAPMEPVNAVANVTDGACEIWAGTQTPDGAQHEVAQMLGIPVEKVTVNAMLLGGGFGRRLSNDYIAQAVEVSRAAKMPVKLLWTREDDMRHDMFRPASHHSIRGAVAGGTPVAFSHQMVEASYPHGGGFGNPDIPYEISGAKMKRMGIACPVVTGAWRAVEHTLLSVANECFIDELAHAASKDPFEFRRALIRNERLRKVLETVAEKSGWGKPLPKGIGRGIACFEGYGSYAAHVVELEVKGQEIRLRKVWVGIDCGIAFNPLGVEAVAQGACSDGLATALSAAITVDKGSIVEENWDAYRWLRMNKCPVVDVTILEAGGEPGGLGEPVYPSAPAAVANAVFAATGKRVRRFPIRVSELV